MKTVESTPARGCGSRRARGAVAKKGAWLRTPNSAPGHYAQGGKKNRSRGEKKFSPAELLPAARRAPQSSRLVPTPADECFAVRRKGHAAHGNLVAPQAAKLTAGVRIPQDHLRVLPARGERSAVGRERYAEDPARMSVECRAQAPRARAPQLCRQARRQP